MSGVECLMPMDLKLDTFCNPRIRYNAISVLEADLNYYLESGGGAARRCVRDAASPAHAHAPAPAPPAPPAPFAPPGPPAPSAPSAPSVPSASSTNAVKSERLSPHDSTTSRSRSVTPSTSSYPGTPPAPERDSPHAPLVLPPSDFKCSNYIRTLASKYTAPTTNVYFPRANGLSFDISSAVPNTKPINYKGTPYCGVFSRLTRELYGTPQAQTLTPVMDERLAKSRRRIRTQDLGEDSRPSNCAGQFINRLWTVFHMEPGIQLRRKRSKAIMTIDHSPLDLSAAGESAAKRARLSASPSTRSDGDERDRVSNEDRSEARECLCAEARKRLSAWSVDEVCDFVSSIDICAEYAPNFREQRIDGSGLPLLTEEHLTGMLQMKLGPALKLRAVVARSLEPCAQCVAAAATATSTATAPAVPTLNMPKVNGTSLKSEPRSNTTSPS